MVDQVDVTVVGAGPTGLLLAAELALAGTGVEVLDARGSADLVGTRARGFHARTIELLDQRGVAERFLAAGTTSTGMRFGDTPLDIGALPSRHACTLGLGQSGVEDLLLAWVAELGVPVVRGAEVVGFAQDDDGVDVHLADGGVRRTAYLVGADGGRSVVRRGAGIEMVGADATRSYLIGEASVTDDPPPGLRLDELGVHAVNLTGPGSAAFVLTEQQLGPATEPTLEDLRAALAAVHGTDFGVHDVRWLSRFTDATRQAAEYRRGRVLLAGDAAHVHPPTGGQGIGLGAQDAVNLGWKLAQVVRGTSPADLLDTYRAERHPATARVLENVLVQSMLQRADARTTALRATFTLALAHEDARVAMGALLTGLDVRLEGDEGDHPLLGRRVPDVDLLTDDGPKRVFELLHEARPVLLDLGSAPDAGGWAERVRHVRASYDGAWVLPVVGVVPAPSGVLVRPDGHVAWVGQGSTDGLEGALTRWFGPPL